MMISSFFARPEMDLPGVPQRLLEELREAALSVGIKRLALVGGVVRDQLLHQRFGRDWCGVPDLDWVVEGDAAVLPQSSRDVAAQIA